MTEKMKNEHPALTIVRRNAKNLKKDGSMLTHMQLLHILAQKCGYKSWTDMVTKLKSYG